jgi:sulfite reductase alpha subunit-like flavoprotein
MNPNIPFIPDSAPFTPEQRAWLNGLLAGIFSSAPAPAIAPTPAGKRIAVLYASQSGTAEGLARKLAKELKTLGHAPAVSTLVGYTPAALAAEPYALILASTYGDGDAPDGVGPFYEQLCLEHFPRMESFITPCSRWAIATTSISANLAQIWMPSLPRWEPIRSASVPIAMWMSRSHLPHGRKRSSHS